jgi:hypothetical protein
VPRKVAANTAALVAIVKGIVARNGAESSGSLLAIT